MIKFIKKTLFVFIFLMIFFACKDHYAPKQIAYLRTDLPEHSYKKFEQEPLPYSFLKSKYSVIKINDKNKETWIDIFYPKLNATIYFSYKKIKNNEHLYKLFEDARTSVNKHQIKATSIQQEKYINNNKRIFATIYDLEGEVATPLQFTITDSTKNFLRASLYFNCKPNSDSLSPMIKYIRKDVLKMIESFKFVD